MFIGERAHFKVQWGELLLCGSAHLSIINSQKLCDVMLRTHKLWFSLR